MIELLGYIPTFNKDGIVVPGSREIGAKALSTLRKHRHQGRASVEAGGILIGRYIHVGDEVGLIVDEATEPGPQDVATYATFHREEEPHAARLAEAWYESGMTQSYLGEWHTHHEPHPHPSALDMGAWSQTLVDMGEQGFTAPYLFVIVGLESIGMWQGWAAP